MDAERKPTEGIGALLETLRRERDFTKLALADTSGVSATYIAMIEGGLDTRTGKEIRPSPDTLRKLAGALARGSTEESRRLYTDMMAVLGYLPEEELAAGPDGDSASVTLRDPRLRTYLQPVVEDWDRIPGEQQNALLTLLKLIEENRRRR